MGQQASILIYPNGKNINLAFSFHHYVQEFNLLTDLCLYRDTSKVETSEEIHMVLLHSTLPLVIGISRLLIQWLVCSMEPPALIRTFAHGEIHFHMDLHPPMIFLQFGLHISKPAMT
jgi:hypothetical protein